MASKGNDYVSRGMAVALLRVAAHTRGIRTKEHEKLLEHADLLENHPEMLQCDVPDCPDCQVVGARLSIEGAHGCWEPDE